MNQGPFSLWVYLSQTPLLWLTVTLLVYAVTDAISQATGTPPRGSASTTGSASLSLRSSLASFRPASRRS